jgi:hypothetical protein
LVQFGWVTTVHGQTGPPVVVHLENHARLSVEVLATIEAEVAAIFRTSQIELAWDAPWYKPIATAPCDGRRHVGLGLVNIEERAGEGFATADVLGRAAPGHARAWVFTNRIARASEAHPVAPTLVTARVIAHELGHLLLAPGTPHSKTGIMRANLDWSPVGNFQFTPPEAQAMQSELLDALRRNCEGDR